MLGISASAQNQTENSIWYAAGFDEGIDFNSVPPKQLTQKAGFSASSIANKKGELIIYTDGNKVWNKNHDTLLNGNDLKGKTLNNKGVAKSIIIRQPKSNRYFYIFTSDAPKRYYSPPKSPFIPIEPDTNRTNEGVFFSIVDMEADSGRGAVIQKNVSLFKNSAGKLAAAQIQNSDNFWVVGLQEQNDSTLLYAYSLTDKGLNTQPVITDIEMEWVSFGQMQFSFGAERLAISEQRKDYNKHYSDGQFCLFDFNTATGKAGNKKTISAQGSKADFNKTFGLEFSPDGRFIYANFARDYYYILFPGLPVNNYLLYGSQAIYQVEVSKIDSFSKLTDVAILIDSFSYSQGHNNYGFNLRLGPDYKLYVNTIAFAIHQPNKKDSLCNLKKTNEAWTANTWGGGNYWSLPIFPKIENYFLPKAIYAQEVCIKDTSGIGIYNLMYDSIVWNMGNGEILTTKDITFNYLYKDTDTYTITAKVYDGGSFDVVSQKVKIYGITKPSLGNDTLICTGSPVVLGAYHPTIDSYSWSTLEKDSVITVKEKGVYEVKVYNKYCSSADTIVVQNIYPCGLQAQNFCYNDSTLIEIKNDNLDSIIWDLGNGVSKTTKSSNINYVFPKSGAKTIAAKLYHLGLHTETRININIHKVEKPNLGNDTLICLEDSLKIDLFDTSYWRYKWSNGSDDHAITIKKEGDYWLEVERNQCTNGDTITVKTLDCGIKTRYHCLGDSTLVELKTSKADSITFSFGDGNEKVSSHTKLHHRYPKEGEYYLTATINRDGLTKTISKPINIISVPKFILGENRTLCEGAELNPYVYNSDVVFNWNDSINTPTIKINQSGIYRLTVSRGICKKTDSVYIKATDCSCRLYFPSAFTADNNALNELFAPTTNCEVKNYNLKVFNRWGALIFESNQIINGWSGKYKDMPVPNGAYMWIASYQSLYTGKKYLKKGTITLLR